MSSLIACSKCRVVLLGDVFNIPDLTPCPACQTPIQVELFPAYFKPVTVGRTGQRITMDGESTCFYHAEKKAVVPCDVCGRFLCGLCDLELNDQHICPHCLNTAQKKGRLPQLDHRRTLWDTGALLLAVLPILLVITVPFLILTAPAAILLALRHWNTPSSLIQRTKIRPILTIVFGLAGIFVWLWWTHTAFGWP